MFLIFILGDVLGGKGFFDNLLFGRNNRVGVVEYLFVKVFFKVFDKGMVCEIFRLIEKVVYSFFNFLFFVNGRYWK